MRIYFVLEEVYNKDELESVNKLAQLMSSKGHIVEFFAPNQRSQPHRMEMFDKINYYYLQGKRKMKTEYIAEKAMGFCEVLSELPLADIMIALHPHATFYCRMQVGTLHKIPIVFLTQNSINIYSDPGFINYADIIWTASSNLVEEIKETIGTNVMKEICNLELSDRKEEEIFKQIKCSLENYISPDRWNGHDC